MILDIIYPVKSEQYVVDWVEVNTSAGNYVIQSGHAPMVVTLAENQELLYKPVAQALIQKIMVERGIVTISRTGVTALLGTSL